ncbi:allantoinase AllB [Aureispira anguillae]|uniref:allantoinase n=1 Tax=Aureispira anguillae TaxID=2864201 RepID=A0A915YF29_9BACT|nr:allantoinase AllB [Aureispira anguillae]BDS11823.1 allantoinase AllB [Aureispira anguillae]
MNEQLIIYSKRVMLPDTIGEYTIWINQGKIEKIQKGCIKTTASIPFYNFENEVLMPGIIDPHVHINEPGRTEWEGFYTGTTAAAAGGVTTLVDMPLNSSPVTVNVKELDHKLAATKGKLHVNSGFWGGIIPGNTTSLAPLAKRGVLGFKAFLTHSGIDEFPNADEATLRAAYEALKGTNLPILVHCELASGAFDAQLTQNPTNYLAYLASRPRKWENDAVALMLQLAEEYQHSTHIVHLSSSDSLPAIRAAKKRGVPVTVETCPHYIFFDAETIPNGDTRYKCAPPIREQANNVLLWEALMDGTLDFIGSDHSPAPPRIKELDTGNYQKAWGGISGIQFTLPALWTKGQAHGLTLERIRTILCEAPAQFIGLEQQKGKIKLGYDADLVVWNPEEWDTITRQKIEAKHKVSPYEGRQLQGLVKHTFVNGVRVWSAGKLINPNQGQLVLS